MRNEPWQKRFLENCFPRSQERPTVTLWELSNSVSHNYHPVTLAAWKTTKCIKMLIIWFTSVCQANLAPTYKHMGLCQNIHEWFTWKVWPVWPKQDSPNPNHHRDNWPPGPSMFHEPSLEDCHARLPPRHAAAANPSTGEKFWRFPRNMENAMQNHLGNLVYLWRPFLEVGNSLWILVLKGVLKEQKESNLPFTSSTSTK